MEVIKADFFLYLIKNNDVSNMEKLLTENGTVHPKDNLLYLNLILNNNYKASIIHLFAQYNSFEICRYIFAKCPNFAKDLLKTRDSDGKTPLHTACTFGSLETLRILIENNANVDDLKNADWSSLMIAVAKSNIPLISLLLEKGSDITLCDKHGWNVLHLAIRHGNIEVVSFLNEYLEGKNQENLWYEKNKNGRTIMHIAAINSHVEMFDFIVDNLKFSSLYFKDVCGVNPFMDAARANCVLICQIIESKLGNELLINDIDNTGRTALHMAAETNAYDAIEFLLSNRFDCNINQLDRWKQSPLFLAVKEGHFEATKLLIDFNADKNLKDDQGRSLIDICKQFKHDNLLSLLT